MPLYEYKCPRCGETKDVLKKMNDTGIQYCLSCGTPMYRLFSASISFDFRGEGFYSTDYKNKK